MLYRENGQFKTSYRADQQIFPIAQDRIALLLLAFAFVAAGGAHASPLPADTIARILAGRDAGGLGTPADAVLEAHARRASKSWAAYDERIIDRLGAVQVLGACLVLVSAVVVQTR